MKGTDLLKRVSCAGRLRNIRKWLDRLFDQGEAFGYQVEPTKSIIIVSPDLVQQANDIFGDLNIQVATSARFLGGCIGEPDGVKSFVKERVETWVPGEQCQLPCLCCQEIPPVGILCVESLALV